MGEPWLILFYALFGSVLLAYRLTPSSGGHVFADFDLYAAPRSTAMRVVPGAVFPCLQMTHVMLSSG